MAAYNWGGLRFWRIVFAVSLVLCLPVSFFVAAVVGPSPIPPLITGLTVALLVVAGSLYGVRAWCCPRCGSSFAKRSEQPWVAPWAGACYECSLPEFTASEADAPPVVTRVAPREEVRVPGEDHAVAKVGRRRTRVALMFAIPLLYLTMCRLPAGEVVKTASGRELRVIDVMRNKLWMSGHGTTESVDIAYYSAAPNDTNEVREALSIVIPMVEASDSIIRVSRVKNSWWLRTFGIKVARDYSFKRQGDGTWAEGL